MLCWWTFSIQVNVLLLSVLDPVWCPYLLLPRAALTLKAFLLLQPWSDTFTMDIFQMCATVSLLRHILDHLCIKSFALFLHVYTGQNDCRFYWRDIFSVDGVKLENHVKHEFSFLKRQFHFSDSSISFSQWFIYQLVSFHLSTSFICSGKIVLFNVL